MLRLRSARASSGYKKEITIAAPGFYDRGFVFKNNYMKWSNKIVLIFGLIVAVFILFFGITLLCTNMFIDKIPKPNRTFLGIVFILYAAFRGYRAKMAFDKMKD